ncbi:MAG: hypothetical protein M4579_006716 [Chaenotheca gracillima]|nr:MAG: hypothetical protein M4579_006716 [Chaenotheca gracillima]
MEQRARIPPGLPRANPTVSYWQDPPSTLKPNGPPTPFPKSTDIIIVGSGITGACIAFNLLQRRPGAKVVMLEARRASSPSSKARMEFASSTGGHTKGGSYRSFPANVSALGEAEAVKIARLEYDSMKGVHAFARQYGIECDSFLCDTVDVFFDDEQLEEARGAVAQMRASPLGSDESGICAYTFYDAEQARTKFLTPAARGAVVYEAGSISAYAFVIGVLRKAMEMGLEIHEETPALGIRPLVSAEGIGWLVETPRGKIGTESLILATNGYTPHLYPELRGFIVPMRGQVTAQRPGAGLPQSGLEMTYSFIYADGYDYMISRPAGSRFEGDIVIGGGLTKADDANGLYEYGETDDEVLNPAVSTYLHQSLPAFFGANWGDDHPHGRVRKEWTGIMGYTPDGYPLVDHVPGSDGLYIAAAFQGHGMVLCFLCARALAQIVLAEDSVDLGDRPLDDWFPQAFRARMGRFDQEFQGKQLVARPGELNS